MSKKRRRNHSLYYDSILHAPRGDNVPGAVNLEPGDLPGPAEVEGEGVARGRRGQVHLVGVAALLARVVEDVLRRVELGPVAHRPRRRDDGGRSAA